MFASYADKRITNGRTLLVMAMLIEDETTQIEYFTLSLVGPSRNTSNLSHSTVSLSPSLSLDF